VLDPNSKDLPDVKVLAEEDSMGGWNISLVTTNFTFTPENVGGEDVEGEGHAHLYVDGEKVTRLYGNHYYLSAQGEGDHEITVTLNANSHKDYTVDGELVSGTTTVTEMSEATETDDHAHDEDGEAAEDDSH
jgi:hypothetical protein